jgi:subtilase family protein
VNFTAIAKRVLLVLALAFPALAATASASFELPRQWDRTQVAVNRDQENTFLLRPGQIVAGPGDAADVARVLTGWRVSEQHPFGLTLFKRTTPNLNDPAREVREAIARVRKYTSTRPQGPARVEPNYVLVGEAATSVTASAINFYGEPRVQGGPGSSVRQASLPGSLPLRTTTPDDGLGTRIAVLDTGMFDHEWLKGVQRAPNSDDIWDIERDGYGDAEAGHGTFIAGLLLQVAPATSVYAVKVLDSHGVGDDFDVATKLAQLPLDIDVVNLSLGGYTDHDVPPLAIETALEAMADGGPAIVAAAGNQSASRPFWPAAFDQVLAVGAVENRDGKWSRADYSNHGPWVDATARGTNLQSTFARARTKVALGPTTSPFDPIIAFDGWAAWDGTSFATPIAAAMIARTMYREGLTSAREAEIKLLANAPQAPQPEFPHAVFLDELEGARDPAEEAPPAG